LWFPGRGGYRPFDIAACRRAFPDFRYTSLADGLSTSPTAFLNVSERQVAKSDYCDFNSQITGSAYRTGQGQENLRRDPEIQLKDRQMFT
jgi:hypothetical protein